MLSLRIAYRFLRRSWVQSVVIVAGIAVGIAVQVFVGSLITSLQASLLDKTIGSSPHIVVDNPKVGKSINYTDAMRQVISGDSRVSAVARVDQLPMVYTNGTDSAPLSVIAGDAVGLNGVYNLSQHLVAGQVGVGSSEIMVGREFATKFGLGPGSSIMLVDASGRRSQLRVSGLFDLGSAAVNQQSAFASLRFAAASLGYGPNQYSAVDVKLFEPFQSAAVRGAWAASPVFSGVEIRDWQIDQKDLLSALQSQSSSSYLIQVFVLVAVALGIASTLAISAVQKTRQIGILKAMGMTDTASGRIFLWQAAVLGAGGTIGGVLLGLGLIAFFQLASAGAATPLFPIHPQAGFIVVSSVVGVSVALLSSIVPIRATSRLDPIEVIQSG